MHAVDLAHPVDYEGWRAAARRLVLADARPESVDWRVGPQTGLFGDPSAVPAIPAVSRNREFSVPRDFLDLAETITCHRDPARFALLYSLLWRLTHGEPKLLDIVSDREVSRAEAMARAIRRDIHKMHAFVRFREREGHYLAWFEPDHFIVERAAPFFARRFANMDWSILTPDRSVHWDGETLHFTPGASKADVPDDDALEDYWRSYYSSIFNPARLKIEAMKSEMPRKYWHNLPEARMIRPLIRDAGRRVAEMAERGATSPSPKSERWALATVPEPTPESGLDNCRRCSLWRNATQAVPGEGPMGARLMLVGEQPGDQEDLAGRAFVGPAGQLLDRAMVDAGITRADCYVTNAVKHFKFTPRGKRRIHQKPDVSEVEHCRWWLTEEVAAVRPRLIVALGATAGRALLRRDVAVQRERGAILRLGGGGSLLLTVHPSYLLRLPDPAAKVLEYDKFVADLRTATTYAMSA
ncbi:DNA polymerase [Skermanella stibiiresistens SB22]|uniref:Type-4 uracil-DNA glycosylase n=1 Tax=Skermanella stibiiresistens SB22 TaxID=1385369 RepID=W9H4E3_9PROT|nr:UdgX family uracil-DNA binding protein [Skermanella stibiiresistens]EWY39641.1 DNA polymerase [Skermanella stibiiresistens SB22]